ncbi:MAG TPA: hypothetical protein VII55_02550 [Candidatus Saccharimonadales bacterium]
MTERQPGFTLYRPVIGINYERLARLQKRLGLAHLSAKSDIKALFGPASKLQATILWHGELNRLFSHVGQVNKEEARELASYVQQGLPLTASDTLFVPLLPSRLHPPKKTYKKNLVVAVSETVKVERLLAQNAVRSFFELDEVPEGVWSNDDYAAGVRLARSKDEPQFNALQYLNELLIKPESPLFEEEILPVEVQLAPVASPRFSFDS